MNRVFLAGAVLVTFAIAAVALVFMAGGGDTADAQTPVPPRYKCYTIAGPDIPNVVNIQTQFGTESNVAVGAPALLCAPAITNGVGTFNAPHLKCYVIPGTDPPHTVDLATQFLSPETIENDVAVGQATMLCVPAIKEVTLPAPVPPTPVPLDNPHYKCYQIAGSDPTNMVSIQTQFSNQPAVELGAVQFLCAPALKQKVSPTPGPYEGYLQTPHLKCYLIPADDPPHVVNLTTQFPVENNVQVGQAVMLCGPVQKTDVKIAGTPVPPVGGNVNRPDTGGLPESAGSSDGSSFPWYAVVAAVAMVAVIGIAAGSYVRRRSQR